MKRLAETLSDLDIERRLGYAGARENVENVVPAVGRASRETARATADKKGSGVTSFDPARSRALAEPPEEGSDAV